ncbi:transposase [Pleurocapsa sp. CCALA 161]|uniref:RNA-guided endonuclease InsQ/TnpB family protein n=1 Tax=Pleurocapsa sp. CCALA 161 TaxID=2107688 RepID=UPI000D04E47A|nr:RNA-guided endonuclease TnpB family protein [Pleurocapsa sp. CCALA 161]PSB08886.1 transposase [Pleurocapsa sp. CCALA 161]
MKQLRGFKYRFYPTSAQRLELAQTFGCTRFVYNWALALRTNSYYQDNVSMSYTDTSNALTKLKKDPEKPWLKKVSAVPLQQGLRHLNTAFTNFFAGRNKYPRFKKKNNRQSAHYAPNAFKWVDGKLTLAKMSQPLKIRWSRYFTGEPSSVTISKDPSNRYFVSFLVEEELEQWDKTNGKIGVDLGVKDVMVTSSGFASGNPKLTHKYQARLKTLQRRLAKKKKGSNNRYKARLKVARLHAKIADCRKDFLHKLTTQLVSENQAIYTETLAVKNMMANHKLAKAIADCGWGEALRQFQYKCKWHERELGAIDRWFPSSKRCNPCGHILDKLPLAVREWVCPSCNSCNLRDKNAALNILAVGQTAFACGSGTGGEIDLLSLAIQG